MTAHDLITGQIATEIRKLNSILTDEADKPAIIQRIAALKATLDSNIVEEEKRQPTTRELIAELIKAIRHR